MSELKPWARNARKHSRKQLKQIAASIEAFGFLNPVLIDAGKVILAGHGRVEAARLLGRTTVPCLFAEHLTEAQKRAYALADNKIALNASWDEELLAAELRALASAELDVSVDLTGFSIAEIDALIDLGAPEEDRNPRDDRLPAMVSARVRPGDLWALGPHRLICGDSCDRAVVARLMAGAAARMVFTDPPYNVPIDGHVGGLGRHRHREFAMASGEMSAEAFTGFLRQVFGHLAAHSVEGAIHYICMDWRHMGEIQAAAIGIYSEMKNLIVWVKDAGGMGSFYRSRHELIFVFKKGTEPHLNSFELGQHGRYRTNVWEYRGANLAELALHPTVKPVAMIADAIRDVSGRGEIVLDLFGGSGSTLIAAEKTGRRGYLCEIDPAYCDLIVARWEDYAKDEAVLLERAERMASEASDWGAAR
ncbi:site-specific DNA-methyltransferase [Frigidibacter sp. RF13]|uniref:site-specific DNA-methyltransferase n=1 Tax=Frigidibacter sp. RF13 TaxID=2997340 RepID=UPI00226E5EF2|nr:DNA methyltransferase [Frigidibacter sp. RF13]